VNDNKNMKAPKDKQSKENEKEARKAKAKQRKGVVIVLKREYPKLWPKLSKEEQDLRVEEALAGEPWFKDIVKKHRLSKDLQTDTGPAIVGGVNDPKTEDDTGYGEWVGTGYHAESGGMKTYDELEAEEKRLKDIDEKIRVAEWAFKLAVHGRTQSVRLLHISIGLQLLRNQLQISELVEYHNVTVQRIKQAIKEVKSFETS
jgi:hypothetical protein